MKPIKNIAILGSHISWDGGVDFLCFLVNGIIKKDPEVNLFLVIPYHSISVAKSFLLLVNKFLNNPKLIIDRGNYSFENKNTKIINAFHNHSFNFKIVFYNYSDSHLGDVLKSIKADVIFPSIKSLGTSFPVPYVAYIPDLQHKYFPDFFSKSERDSRDRKYSTMLKECKAIIVNSKAVKEDLIKLYSHEGKNVYSLPFTPPAPLETWLQPNNSVSVKYNLPKRYFIISNQFWKHKSHVTAFEALAILLNKKEFEDIQIICTGKLEDERVPEYINNLLQRIKELKIEHKIKFLGFISKNDQIQIMLKSIGVIQPTLFEGGPGGGVVYNAVSMGVPCIISDIPINKEITEQHIYFFKAGSPEDLVIKMEDLLRENIQRPGHEYLIEKGNQRVELLGSTLFQIFNQASI